MTQEQARAEIRAIATPEFVEKFARLIELCSTGVDPEDGGGGIIDSICNEWFYGFLCKMTGTPARTLNTVPVETE